MRNFKVVIVLIVAFTVVFSSVGYADEEEPTWIGWFVQALADAFFSSEYLPDPINGAIAWVKQGVQEMFCWLVNLLLDFVDWCFSFVFPQESDSIAVDEETAAKLFSAAYSWIPIDTIIAVLTAVFSCRLAVWSVNFVLMWVPGL